VAAKAFYRQTLMINPRHSGALNNLGVIAIMQNNWQEAQTFLGAAANLEPTDAKVHYLLAKALFEEGNRKAATTEIDTAIRLNPQQPEFKQLKNQIEPEQP
jgi:Flp pilus assembly protein TadD